MNVKNQEEIQNNQTKKEHQDAQEINQDFVMDMNEFQTFKEKGFNSTIEGNTGAQNSVNDEGPDLSPSFENDISHNLTPQQTNNQQEEGNGFFITGINTNNHEVQDDDEQLIVIQEEEDDQPDPVDKYRHVAVVDCSKAFSQQECVLISDKHRTVGYLNSNNHLQFRFDQLITSHGQVSHLCERMVHKFLFPKKKIERDKIVINFADQFNSNNNAGFNVTNFKVQFINQFLQEVINDYEKSIIGTFTKTLFEKLNGQQKKQENDQSDGQILEIENQKKILSRDLKSTFGIYFTITKFENDIGFSLIHQDPLLQEDSQLVEQKKTTIDPVQIQSESFENQNIQSPPSVNAVGKKPSSPQQYKNLSPNQRKRQEARKSRKALLNRHGVIPEYIQVKEIYQVYTAFTQANLKNSILYQKQARRLLEMQEEGFVPESKIPRETELKEEILLIQFKLIDKASYRTINSFSFVNVPLSRAQDNNVSTLLEVLNKSKKLGGFSPYLGTGNKRKNNQKDFIPYRKSILTRVLADQLQQSNYIVFSHFSKSSIGLHFQNGQGPAKNLFQQIDQLFGDDKDKDSERTRASSPSNLSGSNNYIKKKLTDQQALKILQQRFKKETQQIFNQIAQFREGQKSIEVFTAQAASVNGKSSSSLQPNMFQQILHFLSFKDEILQSQEQGTVDLYLNQVTPASEIQKVIFDKSYIKFIQQRQQTLDKDLSPTRKAHGFMNNKSQQYINTIGYRAGSQNQTYQNQGKITMNDGNSLQSMNRLQYVQYECLKTELKEEYEKRANLLQKRLHQKLAQPGQFQDAHLLLMHDDVATRLTQNKFDRISNTNQQNDPLNYISNNLGPLDRSQKESFLPGMANQREQNNFKIIQKKQIFNTANQSQYNTKNFNSLQFDQGGVKFNNQKLESDQYYKFYLDSAQKAIEMMRKQHKTQQQVKGYEGDSNNIHQVEKMTQDYENAHSFDPNLLYQKEDNNDTNTQIQRSGKSLTNLNQNEFNYDRSNQQTRTQSTFLKNSRTNLQTYKTSRILEPLFGGYRPQATAYETGPNIQYSEGGKDAQSSKNMFGQPKMDIISEHGFIPLNYASKPQTAGIGTRPNKLSGQPYITQDRYYNNHIQPKNSTFLTSITKPLTNMKSSGQLNQSSKPRVQSLTGFSRPKQQMFAPLRDEGRLGKNLAADVNFIQKNTNPETQKTFISGEHKVADALKYKAAYKSVSTLQKGKQTNLLQKKRKNLVPLAPRLKENNLEEKEDNYKKQDTTILSEIPSNETKKTSIIETNIISISDKNEIYSDQQKLS